MTIRCVPLDDIALDLADSVVAHTDLDCDEPLVVIEEAERLVLVDGYKRALALRSGSLGSRQTLVSTLIEKRVYSGVSRVFDARCCGCSRRDRARTACWRFRRARETRSRG